MFLPPYRLNISLRIPVTLKLGLLPHSQAKGNEILKCFALPVRRLKLDYANFSSGNGYNPFAHSGVEMKVRSGYVSYGDCMCHRRSV